MKKSVASEFADLIEMTIVDYVNKCSLDKLLEIGILVMGAKNPAIQGLKKELDE